MGLLSWSRRGAAVSLSRFSDLVLAGIVVGIVAMMIIPLPTPLLDMLITVNISMAVILLLVCIYVSDPLRIATLPSILLITTLFRLGLNVSSTRLILLHADAGEVIRSFGNFVVAGNLVVGAVIFLILTLIQFVVVAKGSERVAEVAARFTLDAMPGKQMSIDAELRAGTIDMDDARRQRAGLQRESQLYGSMDGAMKFVKGDAIAGILITIINIVGGLLIGVLQRGLPAGEATRVYSILTIGDGLVSQIPALLISTAAGIVVTRVASEDEGAHLGKDIGSQIVAQPRAIAIAAGLLLLLALVPGMPTLPFLITGVLIGLLAFRLLRAREPAAPRALDGPIIEELEEAAAPPGVALEVGQGLAPTIDADEDSGRLMNELIPGLRELMFSELGVMIPGVHVRVASGSLPSFSFRVLLSEVPLATGEIPRGRALVVASRGRLESAGITDAAEVAVPGFPGAMCRVPDAALPAAERAGVEVVDIPTQLVLQLGQVLKAFAFEFVGLQETQRLLDSLERTHPALVHEIVPKVVSLQTLSAVLRRLVEEHISIRPIHQILEALAEWGGSEGDAGVLTEYVRGALRRQISHKYAPDGATLYTMLLDPVIEDTVRESIRQTDRGSYLAMEPELSHDIIEAVRARLQEQPADEPPPVILTTMEVRRYVRRLLEVEFPDLPVLSYSDLLPRVQMQPVARVSIG